MNEHFDADETLAPQTREARLFERLALFLTEAKANVPGWEKRLADVDTASITSREALAALPVLRKGELMEAQTAEPPFGGFVHPGMLDGARLFMSPGPVWEPQAPGIDPWGGARAFFAAGIRPGDIVHNSLSYHMTPGGLILDEAARALGAKVFPAGIGNTEQQVEAAAILKPDAYAGTPDFLKAMLDKAAEMGRDLSSFRKAIVSGGALFPSLRAEYRERGVSVMQAYATADLGVIAYESAARNENGGEPLPGMVVNENLIVEIVRPGTDDPVAPGEVGELVVTNFNPAYPLIRFGTGDLSAVLDGPSPCGRTNMRISGWMGRADQRTKIKGMFVDPRQISAITKSVPGIARARLVVTREGERDAMTLKIEPADGASPDAQAIGEALTAHTKLKGLVEIAASLPNDGKVIDDLRDYSK
ncbi:MAG: AMP-binding protein [Salaquimonas sp.]|jgi:phenylacetate-CoA ligase|nr:AMP-binding protein [Salaquimonas sp.]